MSLRNRWRYFVNNLMLSLTGVCAVLAISVLFFILGFLTIKGASSVNLDFFTKLPAPPGELGGGMGNAIVGSLFLVGVATLIGAPIGFIAGIYLSEYGEGNTFSFLVRYTADLLNGVPSIVIGIFAYSILVLPRHHFSALAGSVALAMMLIPIATRSTEQFLSLVPKNLREGALALGASKSRTILTVVVPAGIKGVLTGLILGVARIAGETAPLLFTSFNNQFWSQSIDQPMAALPLMVFNYAISPYEDWHRQAWAAGLILLLMVLLSNIAARLIMSGGEGKSR